MSVFYLPDCYSIQDGNESPSPDIPNTLELIAKEDIDFLSYMSWEGEQPDASRMQVSVDYKSIDIIVCTNCDYKSIDTIDQLCAHAFMMVRGTLC